MAGKARTFQDDDDPNIVLTGAPLFFAISLLAFGNFMAVLDMTIVNVAVPHIAGSLAVAPDESTWTITSYSVAEAIMVPLTGWLAQRFGAVRVLVVATLGFGIFSAACGFATTLGMLVTARVCQGACGGPLMPMSQALLLRIAPRRHQNMALGLWTMTTVLAPIAGPILGGTITDGPGWPWAFFINTPVAFTVAILAWRLLRTRDTPTKKLPVDYTGFVLMAVWIGALQIMMDNGQDKDWFSSPFIVTLAIVAFVGFVAFLIWEFTDEHPIVDLRVFGYGAFGFTALSLAVVYGSFFASIVLIPLWLQTNMNYNATQSGYLVAFNGAFAFIVAPITAAMMSRVNPRLLMSIGMSIVAGTTLYRVTFDTDMTFWQIVPAQLAYGVGMPMFFVPLTAVSLSMVPPETTATAAGLITFLRSMSAALATAIITTIWANATTADRVQLVGIIPHPRAVLTQLGGSPHHMGQALQKLDGIVENQSIMLATNDTFFYVSFIIAAIAIGVWFIPKTKGALAGGAGGH